MAKAFPEAGPQIRLAVLRTKKLQYGDFVNNYIVQAAIGNNPFCILFPIRIRGLCGKKDVQSVDIYKVFASEHNGHITITHTEKVSYN